MPIICWSSLGKAADDATTIDEEITEYIKRHDEDINAHMGEGYSLGVHRLQTVLDHMPYSVLNTFIYPQSRTYKAIVDPAGFGDASDIQSAIDYVSGLGGGTVFIKSGTYLMTADIVIPSNITLEGEDNDSVIIDGNNSGYKLKCVGVSEANIRNVHFVNLNIRNFTFASSDGAINLLYCRDFSIRNCKFSDNVCSGADVVADIFINYGDKGEIKSNYSDASSSHIIMTTCIDVLVLHNQVENPIDGGIRIMGGLCSLLLGNAIRGSNGYGFIVNDLYETRIIGNFVVSADVVGILVGESLACGGVVISGNQFASHGNTSCEAIKVASGSNTTVISGNSISGNHSKGVYLEDADYTDINGNSIVADSVGGAVVIDAGCSKNLVVGNILYNGYTNNGTDSLIANNI